MTRQEPTALVGTSTQTLRRIIGTGTAWTALSGVANLALIPAILHFTSASTYGAWIALGTVIAIGSLADAGIRIETSRRIALAFGLGDEHGMQEAASQALTAMTSIVVPTCVSAAVATPWIVDLVLPKGVPGYSNVSIRLVLWSLLAILAVRLVAGAQLAALRGIQRTDVESISQIAGLVVNVTALLIGLSAGGGLVALLIAFALSTATSLVYQGRQLRQLVPPLRWRWARPERATLTPLMAGSSLALFSQVSDIFDTQWDKLVISHYVSPAAVASFHIGATLTLQAKALAVLPLAPLLSANSELGTSDPHRLDRIQRRLTKMGAVVASTVLGSLFAFGPAFVDLWLGDTYSDAGRVTRWLCLAIASNLISAPLTFQAYAEGRHRLPGIGAAANIAINAVMSVIATPHIGMMGAVYGAIAGNVVGTVIFLALARRELSRWSWPPLTSLSLAAVAATAAVFLGADQIRTWWWLVAIAGPTSAGLLLLGWLAEGLGLRRAPVPDHPGRPSRGSR